MLSHREKTRVKNTQEALGVRYMKARKLWNTIKIEEIPQIETEGYSVIPMAMRYEESQEIDFNPDIPALIKEEWPGQWKRFIANLSIANAKGATPADNYNEGTLKDFKGALEDRQKLKALEKYAKKPFKTTIYSIQINRENFNEFINLPLKLTTYLGLYPVAVLGEGMVLSSEELSKVLLLSLMAEKVKIRSNGFSVTLKPEVYYGSQIPQRSLRDNKKTQPEHEFHFCLGTGADGKDLWWDFTWQPHIAVTGGLRSAAWQILHNFAQQALDKDYDVLAIDLKEEGLSYMCEAGVEVATDLAGAAELFEKAHKRIMDSYEILENKGYNHIHQFVTNGEKLGIRPMLLIIEDITPIAEALNGDDPREAALGKEIMENFYQITRLGRVAGVTAVIHNSNYPTIRKMPEEILPGITKSNISTELINVNSFKKERDLGFVDGQDIFEKISFNTMRDIFRVYERHEVKLIPRK